MYVIKTESSVSDLRNTDEFHIRPWTLNSPYLNPIKRLQLLLEKQIDVRQSTTSQSMDIASLVGECQVPRVVATTISPISMIRNP
ncbi:hypothetical protein TNCV_4186001 [Trichonephila clavipes]|nr:hypothetical protein TNCV_4186001 [Trichonephila clavipes]